MYDPSSKNPIGSRTCLKSSVMTKASAVSPKRTHTNATFSTHKTDYSSGKHRSDQKLFQKPFMHLPDKLKRLGYEVTAVICSFTGYSVPGENFRKDCDLLCYLKAMRFVVRSLARGVF